MFVFSRGGLSYEFLEHPAYIPYMDDVLICCQDVFLKAHEFLRLKFITFFIPRVASHMLPGKYWPTGPTFILIARHAKHMTSPQELVVW